MSGTCLMSNSLLQVEDNYWHGTFEPRVAGFAAAVLEVCNINSDEFWFSDDEVILCRSYLKEVCNVRVHD